MNTFGESFRITTWGESHGRAMGAVIDGCPAGLPLTEEEIGSYLKLHDRPVPELATARQEPNDVEILSGVYRETTIGTPVSLIIYNRDFIPGDYRNLEQVMRPGHGDYTYYRKYHVTGISGGGRASGRECIARLAAGYVAEKLIRTCLENFVLEGEIINLAGMDVSDEESYHRALAKAVEIGAQGDSSGGLIRLTVKGLPPGIGSPVFHGMDAMISAALMSIGAVKSVEIGLGRECACYTGSRFHDDFSSEEETAGFVTNNHGGVLAGITSGESLVVTLAVKPTPSIRKEKWGLALNNRLQKVSVNGRHDRNITPRIIPIARAMLALVIADHLMHLGRINRDHLS